MLVERASGARAHIALVENVDYAEALRLRNADAAARYQCASASVYQRVRRTCLPDGVVCAPVWTRRGASGGQNLAEALHALNEMRRHPSKARRGDEASLELCDRPLYVNDKNVLEIRTTMAWATTGSS